MKSFLLPFYGENSPSEIVLFRPVDYNRVQVITALELMKKHNLRSVTFHSSNLENAGAMLLDVAKVNAYNEHLLTKTVASQVCSEEGYKLFDTEFMSSNDNKFRFVALEVFTTVVRLHFRKRFTDEEYMTMDIPVEDFCDISL